jgi:hypothetical protein
MDRLKRCPFCGASAELVNDWCEHTWIAACCGTGCHANVSVHYGVRKKLPFCTLTLERMPAKKRKEAAKNLCVNMWNRREQEIRFVNKDEKQICNNLCDSVNMFLRKTFPDQDIDLLNLYFDRDEEEKEVK